MAYFETTATKLPQDTDPEWQFLEALAEAIPGSSNANIDRIQTYIKMIRPPGVTELQLGTGHDFDRFSSLFSAAVANEPPYHRALIYYALNKLKYYRFSDAYMREVRDSAADPSAFPKGVPPLSYWEDNSIDGRIPKDFKHEVDEKKWGDAIVQAQNSRVYKFLLEYIPFKPDSTLDKHLATLLDDPNPRVRWRLIYNLASWRGDPAHAPKSSYPATIHTGETVMQYPQLDELVAYWKKKLIHPS